MCSTASNLAPNFNFYLFSNKVYQQIKTQTKSQISASNHTCKILLPIVNLLSDWFPIKTNQTKNTVHLDFTGFIRVFNGGSIPLGVTIIITRNFTVYVEFRFLLPEQVGMCAGSG